MATKTVNSKTYQYVRKSILLPNGERKDLYARTQEELDDKVMEVRILTHSGVDVCSEETFGHFAQMWYDVYKKPYLRDKNIVPEMPVISRFSELIVTNKALIKGAAIR